VIAAATVATAVLCVVPLLAVATGAYASVPMGVGGTSRLVLLFLPQAIAVVLPIAAYRTLVFSDAEGRSVDGRRLNSPGGPGDRFQMEHRSVDPIAILRGESRLRRV
jgi:hypothetical protein